ncbi:Uncharacterised protein [Providencia rettgeri]|nr:Uncharacterised protein [Providencia rettgeri]
MNGRIAHSPSSQKQSHQHTSSQLEFLFEFDDAPVTWSDTEIWQLREGILWMRSVCCWTVVSALGCARMCCRGFKMTN